MPPLHTGCLETFFGAKVNKICNMMTYLNSFLQKRINFKTNYTWSKSITPIKCYDEENNIESTIVTHAVKLRLFYVHVWLSFCYIIKIYILPLIMVIKILKLDNLELSYAYLIFGVLKSMKWRNWLSMFGVYHWVNCLLGHKSSKLHHLHFKFWSKTFNITVCSG